MSGAPSDSYLGGLFRTASAANISRRRNLRKLPPRAPRKTQKPKRERPLTKRAQFAELLSQDLSMQAICEHMGITAKAAERQFHAIRQALGPQAI